MGAAYLGSQPAPGEIQALLAEPSVAQQLQAAGCQVIRLGDAALPDEAALLDQVSAAIAEGLVIGWFEGRMEWGPRALGHRSILGDPRRADMKAILNSKIKRRESFRPFAPSVLRDHVAEWFELDGDVPTMMQVVPIREAKRPLIPAVCHVDGTGRLIQRFHARTGVPMVLNTSFNENEPIVCTPRQALDCFLRTRMDVLVLEGVLVRRQAA
jgi:carbamoyltransferase